MVVQLKFSKEMCKKSLLTEISDSIGIFMLILGENKRLFRCASISWIYVEESVTESLTNVFEIFSDHWHMFRVCSRYVQGMFRVCSEYVESMLRVCSEYVQSMFRV